MSKFNTSQLSAIKDASGREGLEAAVLLAFIDVESAGQIFTTVNNRSMPLIRWEGHYFDRLVPANKRAAARRSGLANPKAQAVKNPKSQAKRYTMLERAKKIDYNAAVSSCSWAIGQVMGAHWKKLGFESAADFEKCAKSGFDGQLDIMMRFIRTSGIIPHLKRQDWSAAARIYNGPKYAKWGYHTKLKKRYEFYSNGKGQAPASAGMLRPGSSGLAVRELQEMLSRAGIEVDVDGDFGPSTERAVREWQHRAGIDADGIAGPGTMETLTDFAGVQENSAAQPIKDVDEVRVTTKSAGLLALVTTFRDKIGELAQTLIGLESAEATAVANWMLAGVGVIGVALAAYSIWGIIKSRRSTFGIEDSA